MKKVVILTEDEHNDLLIDVKSAMGDLQSLPASYLTCRIGNRLQSMMDILEGKTDAEG